jgi:hypothetical protein
MQTLSNFGDSFRGNSMKFSRGLEYSGYRDDFGHNKNNRNDHTASLNSLGFRCDEFISNHTKKHILFAGCSVTWGDWLEKEEAWPSLLLNNLRKIEDVNGFFSVAYPGSSIAKQISFIFKYIYSFGNPDVIFFLMPNTGRFFTTEKINGKVSITASLINKKVNKEYPESIELVEHVTFEMYAMLEAYCKTNGIRLISSSWQHSDDPNIIGNTSEIFDGKFETFFSYKNLGEPEWLYEYMKINKDAKILANDNAHPGTARQAWFAHIMLNKYLN